MLKLTQKDRILIRRLRKATTQTEQRRILRANAKKIGEGADRLVYHTSTRSGVVFKYSRSSDSNEMEWHRYSVWKVCGKLRLARQLRIRFAEVRPITDTVSIQEYAPLESFMRSRTWYKNVELKDERSAQMSETLKRHAGIYIDDLHCYNWSDYKNWTVIFDFAD